MFKNIAKKNTKFVKIMQISMFAGLILTQGACVKNTNLVGYTFKSEDLSQIKVGDSDQATVRKLLGSPSTTSTYGDNIWYYISTEYESIAFFKPKIKYQKIVALSFDKSLKVSEIKEYSGNDAQNVAMVRDVTPAEGRDTGILGELLGNVGRFNSDPARPKKK